jgi:alpha-1,2-mannosyltransferase
MGSLIETLRSGSWLTPERIRLYAIAALIASAGGLLFVLATAHGLNDYQGRPIGTDFSNVYAAGTYALEGRAEAPFDAPAQYAREKEIFGAATPFYGWHYPPFFLFIATLLAFLPYLPALAAWQGTTLALYLWSIRSILFSSFPARNEAQSSHLWLLLAVAFPAVFVNLGHGHNGFLTAALMGLALLLLDGRPVVSGILFGLLAYKPQFGVLIPLVLIATGRWKTFAAAAITVALLALASTLAFGVKVWPAFIDGGRFTREVVLEAGGTGWYKIQSVFAWARMWGAPVSLAYIVQILVTVGLAVAVCWLWRSAISARLKAAALIFAALLSTPYSLDYDLMVLAPAIAFWAADGLSRGFRDWEKTILAALWILPLVARSFPEFTGIPLTVPLLLAAFFLLLQHAAENTGLRLWVFPPRQIE